MKEQWRDVVGYEGWYEVSDHGRIKRIKPAPGILVGRILKLLTHNCGYRSVVLCKNGQPHTFLAHRLVAFAFIGPCPSGYQVNHKNGDKTDNHLENLEWTTPLANIRHTIEHLGVSPIHTPNPRYGEEHGNAKLTEQDVMKMRSLYATGKYSQAELGRRFGVNRATIGYVVRRQTWTHI